MKMTAQRMKRKASSVGLLEAGISTSEQPPESSLAEQEGKETSLPFFFGRGF